MADAFPWARSCSYNPDAKRAFLNRARRQFNRFAKDVGLACGQYKIRVNQGGIAVSGEVYFETDKLYMWVEQSCVLGPVLTAREQPERGARAVFHGRNRNVAASVLDDTFVVRAWLHRQGLQVT